MALHQQASLRALPLDMPSSLAACSSVHALGMLDGSCNTAASLANNLDWQPC